MPGSVPDITQGQLAREGPLLQTLYQNRNAGERMFFRLKDDRRIGTRYDKFAANLVGAICLAAATTW